MMLSKSNEPGGIHMRMKQILSISLAAAAALIMLSGCGMGGTTQTGQNGKTAILVGGWPTPQRPEELETYNKMREDFMKKYPDIDLQVEEWNYSIDTFLPKAASGQLPSVYYVPYTEVDKIIDAGYARDVTAAMQSYGYTDQLRDEIKEIVTRDGKQYMVPFEAYTMGLFVNRSMMEQVGAVDAEGMVQFPETYEQLGELAGKIKSETGKAGFIFPAKSNSGGWHFMNVAWSFGAEFMKKDENGDWKAVFASPECAEALQFVKDLKWKWNALDENIFIDNKELAKMFAGDPAPFVMELPAYHWPTVSNVLRSMWERGWSFIKKAGTIILLSTIVLWFLMSFGWESGSFGMVEELNNSILASIGSAIAWIFTPLGWTNAGEGWKMAVAAITGLIAKENVVATFGMLYGFGEVAEDGAEIWGNLAAAMTPIAAYGFLVFNLLCAPCFAAMGAIKREMNNAKWFWFAIGYQCGLAYVVSLCIYQIGTLITTGTFGIGTVVAFLLVIGFLYLLFRPYKESSSLKVDAKKVVSAK